MAEQSFESAESLARLFHETYEQLAPKHGYATRADTRVFNPTTANGKLMIDVANTVRAKHQADKQAYALEVLEGLLTHKVKYEQRDEFTGDDESFHYVPTWLIDQAIQKINQDLGREV